MNEELVQVGQRAHPTDTKEPEWWARSDPRHELRKVAAFRQLRSPILGEAREGTREHEARSADQIVLAHHEVRGEVVRGPSREKRGGGRPDVVEYVAKSASLLRVEREISHSPAI